jgi:uncharacterized protein
MDDRPPLTAAAVIGDTNLLVELLHQRADVDVRFNGWTPLHEACRLGHLEAVRVLLDHQADVNGGTCEHWTPLHMASFYQNANVVAELISRRANVNAQDSTGNSALHKAAVCKYEAILVQLIDAGGNVHLGDVCELHTPTKAHAH